jgi:ribosomal protein L11 methyltransferase
MNYIEVKIEIIPFGEEFAEQVIAQTEELGYESYEVSGPFLNAYIPEDKYSERDLRLALSFFDNNGEFILKYIANFIREENWNAVWESNFQPITIKNICTVKAGFHKNLPKTKYTITIDPKMAFGTGHHQTTSLMMEAMLDEQFRGCSVLDIGCGTGILAILAVKLKADIPVHAIDIDPVATASAIENSRRNRMPGKLAVLTGDASLLQSERYDVILANINRNIILSDLKTYAFSLRRGGRIILSGFYQADADMIIQEGRRQNLEFVYGKNLDNWAVIKLKKADVPLGD